MSEDTDIFAAARAAAIKRGIHPGPYGVCPTCDTGILHLVRIGECLVAEPCAHVFCRIPYLRGKLNPGPKPATAKDLGRLDRRTRQGKQESSK